MLDLMSTTALARRRALGRAAIRIVSNDEPETAASDAVSHILTALFGPAGTSSPDGAITYDDDAISRAHDFVQNALASWRGDAEDYVTEAGR